MADISDVESGVAALVANVLYPSGGTGPGGYGVVQAGGWDIGTAYGNTVAEQLSCVGLPIRIYRGWPVAQQLDRDTKAGIAHVTVFHGTGMGRLGTGYLDPDTTIPGPPPTITATVISNLVTLTGTATASNLVGLLIDGLAYVYRVQGSDNPMSIAAALAAMITAGSITTDDGMLLTDDTGNPITTAGDAVQIAAVPGGAVMTIGTTRPIIARTGSMAQSVHRSRQQTERIMLTCWAPTPQARDAICKTVDAMLADNQWLILGDQQARMLWAGTSSDDLASKAALWRRDLFFNVTYWTTSTRSVPDVLFGQSNLTAAGATTTTSS